jgi:alpha-ribazole phosphatase
MRLILVRHPKPRGAKGLCYGRLDLECETVALEEAVAKLRRVAAGHRLVTSPARRARDLAARLGPKAWIEPRLQELDFGNWEGRLWQALGREAIETWLQGLPDSAPPNGETLKAMAERCAEWLSELEASGPPVLAITHAGPIRVIRALLASEPLLTYFETAIPFAEPAVLEIEAPAPINYGSNQSSS